MIFFRCSRCQEEMEAPQSLVGSIIRCPQCRKINYIPDSDDKLILVGKDVTNLRKKKSHIQGKRILIWVFLSFGGLCVLCSPFIFSEAFPSQDKIFEDCIRNVTSGSFTIENIGTRLDGLADCFNSRFKGANFDAADMLKVMMELQKYENKYGYYPPNEWYNAKLQELAK